MATAKYQEPTIITFPDMTARVYSPKLNSGAREERIKKLHNATIKLLKGEQNGTEN